MNAESFLVGLGTRSLEAGLLCLLIILIKKALGRMLSPGAHYALWFLVLAKLLLPGGPQSSLGLSGLITNYSNVIRSGGEMGTHGLIPIIPVATDISLATPAEVGLSFTWAHFLVCAWLGGLVLVATVLVRNSRRFNRLISDAPLVEDSALLNLFASCCREVGVSSRIKLHHSKHISTPLLVGIVRPRILLPSSMITDRSTSALRFVLLHELVHVRRGDVMLSLIAAALQAVHWFNPLLWVAFARMRADREIACDARVLQIIGTEEAASYGRTLLSLAQCNLRVLPNPTALSVISGKTEIERRVNMIAQYRDSRKGSLLVGIAVGLSLALVGLSSAKPNAEPAKAATGAEESHQPKLSVGKQPFTLTVDPDDGEVTYQYDVKNNLERMEGIGGAKFRWGNNEINADKVQISLPSQVLTTQMVRAKIRDISITANRYTLDMKTGGAVIEGNVEIISEDSAGHRSITRAEKVTMTDVSSRK